MPYELHTSSFKLPKNVEKQLHAEIHSGPMIRINIHYKNYHLYALSLVISNVFECNTNSVFNNFADSCVTGVGKRQRMGARTL